MLEVQPVGARPRRQCPAERIGQGGNVIEARRHRRDPRRVERQAVAEGVCAGERVDVGGIGIQQGTLPLPQCRRRCVQRCVALR